MTYTTERYIAALTAADEHRLQVETRSYSGEELRQQLDERRKALAEAHRAVGGMTWQPIDMSPRDGTHVLAWGPFSGGPHVVYFGDGQKRPEVWHVAWGSSEVWNDEKFTHWQPLPEPPNA